MSKEKKTTVRTSNDYVLAAIAFCVVGVLFCYRENAATALAMLAFGTVLTVLGLLELINKNFLIGAIEATIGIVIIVLAVVQPNIALILLGIAAILFALFILLVYWKYLKGLFGALIILIFLCALTVGILFIVTYFTTPEGIFIAIGAISIATGVFLILRRLYSAVKRG